MDLAKKTDHYISEQLNLMNITMEKWYSKKEELENLLKSNKNKTDDLLDLYINLKKAIFCKALGHACLYIYLIETKKGCLSKEKDINELKKLFFENTNILEDIKTFAKSNDYFDDLFNLDMDIEEVFQKHTGIT